jgi:hypothetical protein
LCFDQILFFFHQFSIPFIGSILFQILINFFHTFWPISIRFSYQVLVMFFSFVLKVNLFVNFNQLFGKIKEFGSFFYNFKKFFFKQLVITRILFAFRLVCYHWSQIWISIIFCKNNLLFLHSVYAHFQIFIWIECSNITVVFLKIIFLNDCWFNI